MKKRLLTMTFMIMALVCMMTVSASATTPSATSVATYQELTAAITNGDNYIELTDNIAGSNSVGIGETPDNPITVLADSTIEIDLNGYTLTSLEHNTLFNIEENATLTLTDSDDVDPGQVYITGTSTTVGITNYGTLYIDCHVVNEMCISSTASGATMTVTTDGSINNKNVVTVSNTTTVYGTIDNYGTFTNSGTLTLEGRFTNSGSYTNNGFYYGGTWYSSSYLYIQNGGAFSNVGSLNNIYLIWIDDSSSFSNSGSLTNSYWVCIDEYATVTNSGGTVYNSGGFEYNYIPTTEVFGSVAYYSYTDDYGTYYDYYPTLAAVIADAGTSEITVVADYTIAEGETVTIPADTNITIEQDVTITNYGTIQVYDYAGLVTAAAIGGNVEIMTDITVSSAVDFTKDTTITGSGALTISSTFNVMAGISLTLDTVTFQVYGTGIYVQEAGNGATVTIKNCTITSDTAATYVVRGDTTVGTTAGSNYYYDLYFTNNTVTGQFLKPIHIIMGDGNILEVTGNSFRGGAQDTNNRSVTVIVDFSGTTATDITIEDNMFSTMYKAVSVDSWAALPTYSLQNNAFINCTYAFDIRLESGYNDDLDLSYNYYKLDGVVASAPVLLNSPSGADILGEGTVTDAQVLEYGIALYPYYTTYENDILSDLYYGQASVTSDDVVTYYPTFADALTYAISGDTITILENVELTADTYSIEKNLTIVGATGAETFTGDGRFNLTAGCTLTLDSVNFDTDNVYAVYVNGGADTKLTINNCTFEEPNNTNSLTAVVYSSTSTYELVFTNNTVNGDYRKALLVYTSTGATITGNTFTGYDKIHGTGDDTEDTSFITVKVLSDGNDAVITITNNTINTYYKTISVDHSLATGKFTITGNRFINCTYDFDLDTSNTYNANHSLAYNYFDGGLPVVLDSYGETLYDNEGNSQSITFYPYYSDVTLETLVYDDGSTKDVVDVAEETLADDSLSNSEKAEVIATINTESVVENETLLDALNELDAEIVEGNGTLNVATNLDSSGVDQEYAVTETGDVSGLAIAIFGGEATDVSATIGLDITQTEGSTQLVGEEMVAVVAFSVTPYVNYGSGATTVSNSELNAPVTFTLYLPDAFADTNTALVTHTEADGTTVCTDKAYTVYKDGSGNPYITITVTQFSTFEVTYTAYVSTTSSVSATTYPSTVASTDNGSVSVSSSYPTYGATVIITATPDTGYEVGSVTVTTATGTSLTVTAKTDGTYSYKQLGSAVTITVTFVASDETSDDDGLFADVDEDDWFYDAVLWAVENQVTTGKTDTTFVPNGTCTRAEAVTFLYRAMGEPEWGICYPFADVDADTWYTDAVYWARVNGITQGTSDDYFSPDWTCTRSQIITMLWRMMGEPEVTGTCDFTDVSEDDFCYTAVLWAVENGITEGTDDDSFSPDKDCTRAEIVTFLYRTLAE